MLREGLDFCIAVENSFKIGLRVYDGASRAGAEIASAIIPSRAGESSADDPVSVARAREKFARTGFTGPENPTGKRGESRSLQTETRRMCTRCAALPLF